MAKSTKSEEELSEMLEELTGRLGRYLSEEDLAVYRAYQFKARTNPSNVRNADYAIDNPARAAYWSSSLEASWCDERLPTSWVDPEEWRLMRV